MKRVVTLIALLGSFGLAACGSSDAASSERFAIGIDHSAFQPESKMMFEAGETITFVITNDDPIDHEFILGDDAVQEKHEEGKERHHHGEVPGEVSVPAGETRTTTYTFDRPGTLTYACHLPGHFAYGMRGEVVVR